MFPARIRALFLLAFALVKSFFRRLWARGDNYAAFRDNYDDDSLPPVLPSERQALSGFGRCIACGICDQGEAERIARSGGAYRGVMALVLSGSRSMPDYRASAYTLSFVPEDVLRQKDRVCPARVPISRIGEFIRAKANDVGGPLPLPPRVESLRPGSLAATVAAPSPSADES